MILKLGMQHQRLKLFKNFINDDSGLTLAYVRQGQIWSHIRLNGEKSYKVIQWGKLTAEDYID